jgi:hypothetical protein
MAGNAAEWCGSATGGNYRELCGGSWSFNSTEYFRGGALYSRPEKERVNDAGFRFAMDF